MSVEAEAHSAEAEAHSAEAEAAGGDLRRATLERIEPRGWGRAGRRGAFGWIEGVRWDADSLL